MSFSSISIFLEILTDIEISTHYIYKFTISTTTSVYASLLLCSDLRAMKRYKKRGVPLKPKEIIERNSNNRISIKSKYQHHQYMLPCSCIGILFAPLLLYLVAISLALFFWIGIIFVIRGGCFFVCGLVFFVCPCVFFHSFNLFSMKDLCFSYNKNKIFSLISNHPLYPWIQNTNYNISIGFFLRCSDLRANERYKKRKALSNQGTL